MHDSRHSARPVATAALRCQLAAELDGQMLAIPLAAGRGRWPRPHITSRAARALHGSISRDGEFTWWSCAERIAPVTELSAAATATGRVLPAFCG